MGSYFLCHGTSWHSPNTPTLPRQVLVAPHTLRHSSVQLLNSSVSSVPKPKYPTKMQENSVFYLIFFFLSQISPSHRMTQSLLQPLAIMVTTDNTDEVPSPACSPWHPICLQNSGILASRRTWIVSNSGVLFTIHICGGFMEILGILVN